MDIDSWKKKNTGYKNYAHFDNRVSLEKIWRYINDPRKVKQHSFYPFIHYIQTFNKYNKQNGIVNKKRELCYSAHIDRCIYQYYGFLLNQHYNKRVEIEGISDSAVAYRNNLGKNNIHFAKEAFDFIKKNNPCHIIVGDLTHFFDLLDHRYLKKQLCNLLECNSLPDDYYAVYKNITKYATWELVTLLELNGLDNTRKGIKQLNKKKQVLSLKQFKKYKKDYIKPNLNNYGIPQGSAISAVLSNIYMLDFDKQLRILANENQGLYMRYSDDFIMILPENVKDSFKQLLDKILELIKETDGLKLQDEKTQLFYYHGNRIINCNTDYIEGVKKGKDFLNYLGFTFDGKTVTIRDKTLSKYYYRMYRKIKGIVNHNNKYEKKQINLNKIYLKYSEKGARIKKSTHIEGKTKKNRGNFISYVNRAEAIFGKDESIRRGTKKHLQKIKTHVNKLKET